MQNKKNIMLVVGFIAVALIAFYAGTQYSSSKKTSNLPNGMQFGQGGQGGQFGQARGMRAGGGNVFGQIIAKDATSITVQLKTPGNQPGNTTATGTGSKIVFYTGTTTVSKTTDGTIDDLAIGKNISVQGTQNPDGSVNAQTISIRPIEPNATKN